MKSQCTRSFQLIFICFVVALFYLNKIDARSHKRRSPASNLDSYTKLDQLDTSSSAPTRRRQHHRRKHSKFHNITEQDLQHRPEVRLQLSNDYSEFEFFFQIKIISSKKYFCFFSFLTFLQKLFENIYLNKEFIIQFYSIFKKSTLP